MKYKIEHRHSAGAFSLIELLVVVGIIAVLASLLIPALGMAKAQAKRVACGSNLRQIGLEWRIYLEDNESRFPDLRWVKNALPGGYKPWTSWPASDPRSGWAPPVLNSSRNQPDIWSCPAVKSSSLSRFPQCTQFTTNALSTIASQYWMWRFDRPDEQIGLDNFWGKSELQCQADLVKANNQFIGIPHGPVDIELVVDVYFPSTVGSVDDPLKGRAAHTNGRNRLMLDGHVQFLKDKRTGKK